MKKTFRFMAMAVAAIVMAGTVVACDPMDNDKENQEQTGDNTENEGTENEGTENEGTENEGEAPVAITLDGKQWMTIIADEAQGDSGFCLDFGATLAEKVIMWNVTLSDYKFAMGAEQMAGEYIITATDATSGEITVVDMFGENVYKYKDLTATSVKVQASCYDWSAGPDDYFDFVIPEKPVTLQE